MFSLSFRIYFTVLVSIAIWILLTWNYFHGGVPAHHLLDRKDLPTITNWWGGILLPLLSWILLYRIHMRLLTTPEKKLSKFLSMKPVIYGFTLALLSGILLSVFFSYGFTKIPPYMMLGIFLLAFFVPVYRAECLLGFVLGMTFTFGAILPTAAGLILVFICAVIYHYFRFGITMILHKFKGTPPPKKGNPG